MAAQRHDAAAGPADVAQQQLQHRGGADDLHALGLVRPADRVAEGRRALGAGVFGQRVGDLVEKLRRDAAHLLDHLRRVALRNAAATPGRRNADAPASGRARFGRIVARLELPAFVTRNTAPPPASRRRTPRPARRRGNRSRRMLEAFV